MSRPEIEYPRFAVEDPLARRILWRRKDFNETSAAWQALLPEGEHVQEEKFGPRTPDMKPPIEQLQERAKEMLGRDVTEGEADYMWEMGWM